MKICLVRAELFHMEGGWTDGRTDMTNLIVAFRNFANTPKNACKNKPTKNMPPHIRVIMEGQLQQTVKHTTLLFSSRIVNKGIQKLGKFALYLHTHINTNYPQQNRIHLQKNRPFLCLQDKVHIAKKSYFLHRRRLRKCTNKIFVIFSTYIISPVN
jgi:hypothetical protein